MDLFNPVKNMKTHCSMDTAGDCWDLGFPFFFLFFIYFSLPEITHIPLPISVEKVIRRESLDVFGSERRVGLGAAPLNGARCSAGRRSCVFRPSQHADRINNDVPVHHH